MYGSSVFPRPPRWVGTLLIALWTMSIGTRALAAPCQPFDRDAFALEQARWAVATACDCRGTADVQTWNACVMTVLRELRDMGRISNACLAHAHRFELESTCGRPGTAVCCRSSSGSSFRVVPSIRRAGACGSDVERESTLAHRAEACFAYPVVSPDDDAELCGNSRIDSGETCDPPNGTTCSRWCHACPARAGQISLGCGDGATEVAAAASGGSFLVAYTEIGRQRSAAVVKKLDADGHVTEGPIAVATAGRTLRAPAGFSDADSVTSNGEGFYVAWWEPSGKRGRRVPVSGEITAEPQLLAEAIGGGIGMCSDVWQGPMEIAFDLAGDTVHHTQVRGSRCGPGYLVGVPFVFHPFPPPPTLVASASAGRLARGTNDVAAAWWVLSLDDFEEPPRFTLYGGWIEPEPAAFAVTDAADAAGSPGLAALGDTFLLAYATTNEVHAVRFSRSAGLLDPLPGITLGSGLGAVLDVTATSDGERFVVAWKEERPPGAMVRLVHVGADGALLDETPRDVAAIQSYAPFTIAAVPRSILITFTELESTPTSSVRAVVVPN